MSTSDIIQLISVLIALLIGTASVIISLLAMKLNSKMIEESTRPVLSVYGDSVNTGSPTFYIIIKNFGSSPAQITKFNYDFDFSSCYTPSGSERRDFLQDLVGTTIAPQQSRTCYLEYDKINRPIHFDLEYKSSSKPYKDSMTIDLKAGAAMPIAKIGTEGKELRTISYTIQEMLQKSL